jgi:hypothetical protein
LADESGRWWVKIFFEGGASWVSCAGRIAVLLAAANFPTTQTLAADALVTVIPDRHTNGSDTVFHGGDLLRCVGKKRRCAHCATSTKPIITGTSIRGPITAAKAAPLLIPKVATATAIANSKLLDAAVKESVAA